MTTIAYSHKDKVIAVDSRMSSGDMIVTDKNNKIKKLPDGSILIAAGYENEIQELVGEWPDIGDKKYNMSGFMVIDDILYSFTFGEAGLSKWRPVDNDAWGSGCYYALSAMDFGRSAKQAVKYAATRDCKTGGKIRTIKVR